ncbi:hypothetical protein [Demequina subtropica]|nr:hypothetical protein [Demequina subtropica]
MMPKVWERSQFHAALPGANEVAPRQDESDTDERCDGGQASSRHPRQAP